MGEYLFVFFSFFFFTLDGNRTFKSNRYFHSQCVNENRVMSVSIEKMERTMKVKWIWSNDHRSVDFRGWLSQVLFDFLLFRNQFDLQVTNSDIMLFFFFSGRPPISNLVIS